MLGEGGHSFVSSRLCSKHIPFHGQKSKGLWREAPVNSYGKRSKRSTPGILVESTVHFVGSSKPTNNDEVSTTLSSYAEENDLGWGNVTGNASSSLHLEKETFS